MNAYTIYDRVKKLTDVDLDTVINYMTEIIYKLGVSGHLSPRAKLFNVYNYKLSIPEDVVHLYQVAKVNDYQNKCYCDDRNRMFYIETNAEFNEVGKCGQPINICQGFLIIKDNVLTGSTITILRKETSPNFKIFTCESCPDVDKTLDRDRFMIDGNKLYFSFEKGVVLLSYFTPVIDEEGLPELPDNDYLFDAIYYYILYKEFEAKFIENPTNANNARLQLLLNNYEKSMARARSSLIFPDRADLEEIYINRRNWAVKSRYDTGGANVQKLIPR